MRELLRDGGLYLNHGIKHEVHWKRTSQTDFLLKNVFPNGDLAGLSETLTEMERAGLEIMDIEGLRVALNSGLPAAIYLLVGHLIAGRVRSL